MRRLSALCLLLAALTVGAATASAEEAVSIHQDTAHSGAVADPALAPPLHQVWSSQVGGPQASTAAYDWYPIVADGRVFASESVDGTHAKLVALDGASGAVLWTLPMPYGVSLGYDAHTLFLTAPGPGLEAIDPASGIVRWQTTGLDNDASGGRPVASDGEIVVPYDGGVAAYAEADGTLRWRTAAPSVDYDGPVAIDSGRVVMSAPGPMVSAYDAASGASLWSHAGTMYGGGTPGLSVRDGRVWAGSGMTDGPQPVAGDLLDAGGGALLAHFQPSVEPAVSATTAVFHDLYDNTLSAVDARTLQPLWSVDEGARVLDAVIVDGTVYAATGDGRLLTIALATGTTTDIIRLPGTAADLSAGDGRLVVNGDGWVTTFAGTPAMPAPGSGGTSSTSGTSGGTSVAAKPRPAAAAACALRRVAKHPNLLVASCRTAAKGTLSSGRLTHGRKLVARIAAGRVAHGRATTTIHLDRRPPSGAYRLTLTFRTAKPRAHRTTVTHTVVLP